MNKFLLMFSGGKDSLAAYLKLKETFGSNAIKTFTIKSNNDIVWNAAFDLIEEMYSNNIVLNTHDKVYYEAFSQMLKEQLIDASQYYYSSGELDHLHEHADYYPVISHFGFKGFVTPFYGKPKELTFDILKKYNCEFIITQAIVSPDANMDEVYSHIGRRVTATQLEEMYLDKSFNYFFTFQTFAIKCDSVITLDETKIAQFQNSINDNKDKTTSLVIM
jgi:hypothetical protein